VEHDVAGDKDAAREMIARTKQFAVPVLIIDDKDIVVGFQVNKLEELLFPKKEEKSEA
jgi:glutaredoxin